jgi:hypothetical protein
MNQEYIQNIWKSMELPTIAGVLLIEWDRTPSLTEASKVDVRPDLYIDRGRHDTVGIVGVETTWADPLGHHRPWSEESRQALCHVAVPFWSVNWPATA